MPLSDAQCTVTIAGNPQLAGAACSVTLNESCHVLGFFFGTGPYTITLDTSGNGTIVLPRTEIATTFEGGGTVFSTWLFTGPDIGALDNAPFDRVIPDSATADFADLLPP